MTEAEADAASRAAARLETAPTRRIEGSGIRFAYRRLGPSIGTPLVLLQHFSGNIDAWDPAVVNALAVDRPVFAFDNAGVGRSTGQTPDTIAAMARDAVAFIDLLGLSEVDLLGFSLGGCVAQQIAGRARTAGPQAHPRRHRSEGRRGTPVGGPSGGVLPHRGAGSPPAALLHQVGRQPVSGRGVPEAGEGAHGGPGHRQRQCGDRSAGQRRLRGAPPLTPGTRRLRAISQLRPRGQRQPGHRRCQRIRLRDVCGADQRSAHSLSRFRTWRAVSASRVVRRPRPHLPGCVAAHESRCGGQNDNRKGRGRAFQSHLFQTVARRRGYAQAGGRATRHGRVLQGDEGCDFLPDLERIVQSGLGRTGLMLFADFRPGRRPAP